MLLLAASLLAISACREQILHDLTELDANKLLSRLSHGGVSAQKIKQADGRWGIEVESSESMQALNFLNAARALKSNQEQVSKKSDLLSSREEQRFAFERSISAELERTMVSLAGVLEARVHLNLPASDPIFGQVLKPASDGSASVLVVSTAGFQNNIEQIQRLVSGAAGIAPEKVAVIVTAESVEPTSSQKLTAKADVATSTSTAFGALPDNTKSILIVFASLAGTLLLYVAVRKRHNFKF